VTEPPGHRPLVGAGLFLLALGSLGSVWHFFASQSPSSPLHVSFLPGPIQRFAFWALALGVVLPICALVLPIAVDDVARRDRIARWLISGAGLKIAGLLLGGLWGVYGVQIVDPRPRSVTVMTLRIFGDAILVVLFVRLAWAFLRRQRG
jgi:hypothetical protein